MILLIDNYDSFTYNLVQYIETLGLKATVARNDEITLETAKGIQPTGIVISPGPGRPEDSGISSEIIAHFAGKVPLLGICLGHQCIADVHGGNIVRARRVVHGKRSQVFHHGKDIFAGIPSPLQAVRYHSLVVERESLPEELRITAETTEGEIMGIKHRSHDLWGIQFHPESILTEHGIVMLKNFCEIISKRGTSDRRARHRRGARS